MSRQSGLRLVPGWSAGTHVADGADECGRRRGARLQRSAERDEHMTMTVSTIELQAAESCALPIAQPSPEVGAELATPTTQESDAVPKLGPAVRRARARLARVSGRGLLARRAGWAVGFGAMLGACRPLLIARAAEAPLWFGLAAAAGVTALGAALGAGCLVIAGRRQGPSELGAARAVDAAAGLEEVVASGFAFERDGREEPVALVARRGGAAAIAGVDLEAMFPLPTLLPRPRARALRRVSSLALLCILAVCVGSYDRTLIGALIAPPTAPETTAAAALEAAAEALVALVPPPPAFAPAPSPRPEAPSDKGGDDGRDAGDKLAASAREASAAARRGDRRGALSKLDDLHSGGKRRADRARALGASLRQLADAIAPPSGAAGGHGASRPASPGARVAEAIRLLAKKTREESGAAGAMGEASTERMLERLERAAEEARRAGGEGRAPGDGEGSASAAGTALSAASAALSRGEKAEAARMLEEAARRAEAMEEERAQAEAEAAALAEMLEKSGALEAAIQLALLGQEGPGQGQSSGQPGEGRGQGANGRGAPGGSGEGAFNRALAARLAALGMLDGRGGASRGGGSPSERPRVPGAAITPKGSVRAPSQVTEGERAIQAIQGLGKGSEPPASYREVFPAYDAAVEEGIQDERIPAARRGAVRRYFQSIRPE
jgi:hypothetical protein